ncbi:hypothetical protein F7230_04920 [Corynebacterium sp. 320]|uniref:Uncharacterized protein n=1 Tax=Corynebacterium zhongnanshanii TaxID=2768834 RepID=A0ABQ6VE76_9CORY|nr:MULTISPECIES: hypothetical protein [Corynebacterium]KAB1504411.1 hypothetical protein F7230_04920 [Corynebacterium sp. 320]KAB1552490.1 hypothetical protein F7233_01680 [Corynebacterium sp. 321]KAB1554295.1 hypothetical protein F7232_04920 [Corynebacterium sp. 319]KAB3522732.1 hypothetical protein F8377_00675 [Corynebacterium zhongnanshanii]KAB3528547.1 hypothetical protein F8354_04920 [Corynebacterium sp. 250]
MTSMFPSLYRDGSGDKNRATNKWAPGDPTPGTVIAAFVFFLVIAAFMILSGFFLVTAHWDREPLTPEEADRMNFVRQNVRILGVINIVVGLVVAALSTGVKDGYRGKRRLVLWCSALGMFFMLAGWVFQFTGPGQALLALGLAVANLLAWRPASDPYFDAGHRLEQHQEDTSS